MPVTPIWEVMLLTKCHDTISRGKLRLPLAPGFTFTKGSGTRSSNMQIPFSRRPLQLPQTGMYLQLTRQTYMLQTTSSHGLANMQQFPAVMTSRRGIP
ncbi:hypothetical protein SDC9_142412 [bioreactor metagenome]|uniref:Uncharacterized protein n=1 Tax=bioreactor metagenome TaxID=1076179 RepID=A0A645E1J1_9ZZZZ